MRNCNILLCALAVLAVSACADKARISGTVAGVPEKNIIVKQLDVNVYSILDTVKTDAKGAFKYNVKVKKGQPEFVYLFYGNTRIAGLLLEKGEKAVVTADTLGNYSVTGSDGSAKLAEIEKSYNSFMKEIVSESGDNAAMVKTYVDYYRKCVKYVLANQHSLTVIPVLYQRMSEVSPVFSQPTDAILFKNTADTLKTVYPDSRYVKALAKEAKDRFKVLELNSKLASAPSASFPDINLPDINGMQTALSSLKDKVILVHYWDATDAAQKMFNIDSLIPIYNEYHSRGFEIYAICVSTDKADWGSIVKSQKLPWINVCDGLGASSPAVAAYSVTDTPTSFLIVNGEISTSNVKGVEGLRTEIGKYLRQ